MLYMRIAVVTDHRVVSGHADSPLGFLIFNTPYPSLSLNTVVRLELLQAIIDEVDINLWSKFESLQR